MTCRLLMSPNIPLKVFSPRGSLHMGLIEFEKKDPSGPVYKITGPEGPLLDEKN